MSITEISVIQKALDQALNELGLQPDVKIVSVVNRWRWTLEFEQDPDYPDFGQNMIKLEKALQGVLGRPIDLRLESQLDKNLRKKRNVLSGSK